jgi:hypothetical protein
MQGTISPDVARAAIALRRSHPHVTPKEVLELVMQQRAGRVADFGSEIEPGTDFGVIVAEVFDPGMRADDWQRFFSSRNADPVLISILREVWRNDVLPRFAAAYGLSP